MATNIIEIIHTNPSITTVEEFLAEYEIDMTVEEFLNFPSQTTSGIPLSDENIENFGFDLKNSEAIVLLYTQADGEVADPNNIKVGTVFRVPIDCVSKETVALSNNLVVPNDNFVAFLDEKIKQILNNPSYKPLNVDDLAENKYYRISNRISVWIWCRSLGGDDEEGKIFNVTPFVETLTTSVGDNGGNFTLKLAPLACEYDSQNNSWTLRKSTLLAYQVGGEQQLTSRDSLFKRGTKNSVERNKFFFHHLVSSNDLVFIRFERLEIEKDRDLDGNSIFDNLTISPTELPGKIFDMIGLVDTNPMNLGFENIEVDIEISGRDLMKTVIEDGCYFFPTDMVGAPNNTSGNQSPLIQRLVSGEFNFFNAYVDRSIEYSLKFIFSALSKIEIVPSKLFGFYPNKTTKYELSSENNLAVNQAYAAGIWSIIKLVLDEKITGRRLVDSSITTDSGSLLNFIHKVCQAPFVEFYGDTYLDSYFFMARKPPFTETSFISNYTVDVEEEDVYSESLSFDDSEVYSWYRLNPVGNFFGDDSGMSLWEFPVIYFDEYAKIWGSRPCEIVSNYIDYHAMSGKNKAISLDYIEKQATQDLAFIIESHAYLPFTRKGTIVLKGDRRIKRGVNIFHKGTGEIFFVDSVSQQFSINENTLDRQTTITVSRGMVAQHLRMYFNIIDLDKDFNGISQDRKKFKLNKDVFNFFIKRKQWQ